MKQIFILAIFILSVHLKSDEEQLETNQLMDNKPIIDFSVIDQLNEDILPQEQNLSKNSQIKKQSQSIENQQNNLHLKKEDQSQILINTHPIISNQDSIDSQLFQQDNVGQSINNNQNVDDQIINTEQEKLQKMIQSETQEPNKQDKSLTQMNQSDIQDQHVNKQDIQDQHVNKQDIQDQPIIKQENQEQSIVNKQDTQDQTIDIHRDIVNLENLNQNTLEQKTITNNQPIIEQITDNQENINQDFLDLPIINKQDIENQINFHQVNDQQPIIVEEKIDQQSTDKQYTMNQSNIINQNLPTQQIQIDYGLQNKNMGEDEDKPIDSYEKNLISFDLNDDEEDPLGHFFHQENGLNDIKEENNQDEEYKKNKNEDEFKNLAYFDKIREDEEMQKILSKIPKFKDSDQIQEFDSELGKFVNKNQRLNNSRQQKLKQRYIQNMVKDKINDIQSRFETRLNCQHQKYQSSLCMEILTHKKIPLVCNVFLTDKMLEYQSNQNFFLNPIKNNFEFCVSENTCCSDEQIIRIKQKMIQKLTILARNIQLHRTFIYLLQKIDIDYVVDKARPKIGFCVLQNFDFVKNLLKNIMNTYQVSVKKFIDYYRLINREIMQNICNVCSPYQMNYFRQQEGYTFIDVSLNVKSIQQQFYKINHLFYSNFKDYIKLGDILQCVIQEKKPVFFYRLDQVINLFSEKYETNKLTDKSFEVFFKENYSMGRQKIIDFEGLVKMFSEVFMGIFLGRFNIDIVENYSVFSNVYSKIQSCQLINDEENGFNAMTKINEEIFGKIIDKFENQYKEEKQTETQKTLSLTQKLDLDNNKSFLQQIYSFFEKIKRAFDQLNMTIFIQIKINLGKSF